MSHLSLQLFLESPEWPWLHEEEAAKALGLLDLAAHLAPYVLDATGYHPVSPAEPLYANIILADDGILADLNATYRHRNKPTNVLSFPVWQGAVSPDDPLLGDVYVAYETLALEAVTQKKSLVNHVQHLITHGILHLAGFDHKSTSDATVMEQAEVDILKKMAIPNPYIVVE